MELRRRCADALEGSAALRSEGDDLRRRLERAEGQADALQQQLRQGQQQLRQGQQQDQGVQSRCIMFASFKVAGRGSCRCQSNPLLSLVLACSSLFDLSDCHLHQRGQARSRCLLAPLHAGRTPTAHCILACVTVSSRSERLRACSCCCCCCYKHPMWTQVPGILTVYQSPALSKRFYWSVLTASRAASSM